MELKLMYPQVIGYALVLAFIMLFVWRRRKKYKKGVIVANSKYLKKTGYYKYLLAKYHLLNIIIKAVCILAIFTAAYLTARVYKQDQHSEEYYNRDIMLCMDVSGSVWKLDKDMLETFIKIVSSLKDQRFGLTIFDSSPVTVIPLTDDYDYAISMMKELKSGFDIDISHGVGLALLRQTVFSGTRVVPGSSLIGDGLAYCSSTFNKDKDRTKVVILATDNLSGKGIFTLPEAAQYSKENDVKVYTIHALNYATSSYITSSRANAKQELVDTASLTGGKYYDSNSFSTDDMVKNINELDKTAIVKETFVTNEDLPQIIFPYLLYLIPILFVLDWRVRI